MQVTDLTIARHFLRVGFVVFLTVWLPYANYAQCSANQLPQDGTGSGCEGIGTATASFTTRIFSCNPARTCSFKPVISHIWYTHPTQNSTVGASVSYEQCDPPGSGSGNDIPINSYVYTTQISTNYSGSYWVQPYIDGVADGSRKEVKAKIVQPISSLDILPADPPYRSHYCETTTVSFTAVGSTDSESYRWYKVEGSTLIEKGSGPTFQTSEAGVYEVQADGSCGQTEYRRTPPLNFVPAVGPVSTPTSDSFCHGVRTTSTSFATAANAFGFEWSITGSGNTTSGGGAVLNEHTGKMESTTTVHWSTAFTGSATIRVRAYGCETSESIKQNTMHVHPIPESTITPAEPLITCGKDSVHITGLPNLNYEWYYNGLRQINEISQSINAYKTGKYSLRVKSNANCYSTFNNFIVKNDYDVDPSLLCDDVLNWIETTAHDENNIPYSNSKSYFDFAGKPLQSQVRMYERPAVFASQTINDRYDRPVISTLSAPTLHSEFKYKHLFVTNGSSARYSAYDFDSPSTIYNPLPVGDATQGTLGWYYSTNNNVEDHVPVTDYPYSRTEFYEDGTGEVKRSGSPGDFHRLGAGHEILTGTFPVHNELFDYGQRLTELGTLLGSKSLSKGIQSVARDQNGEYAISITDKEGRTIMTARKGTSSDNVLQVSNTITLTASSQNQLSYAFTYLYLLEPVAVSISGSASFVAEDIVNGIKKDPGQSFAGADGKWPAGFYKIGLTDLIPLLTISYTSWFKDISYQFYDDAGRLRYSVSPNGCEKWLSSEASFAEIDKTEYQYNHQGWLLKMIEPDAGTTEYRYRKDGKIRFSQNAKQKQDNTFSYTNYDELGRPVESGQYTLEAGLTFTSLQNKLEGLKDRWMKDSEMNWTGTKTDWVKTYYDDVFASIPNVSNTTFKQAFLLHAVSGTQNENNTTWYSYDEQGRVTWMAQKPERIPVIFVTEYAYDFLGNVLTVANSSYNTSGAKENTFYQHYEYDKDKRLQKAYTSVDGTNKELRAKYHYYLHGPLKRIELGDKVQGIDFVYNINGWLKQINHPDNMQDPGQDGSGNEFRKDAFGMALDYYESNIPSLFPISADPMQFIDPVRIHGMPVINDQIFDKVIVNNGTTRHGLMLKNIYGMPEQYNSGYAGN